MHTNAIYASAKQLAQLYGVSKLTISRWEKSGAIPPGTRIGKRLKRWDVAEVEKHLHNPHANRETRELGA